MTRFEKELSGQLGEFWKASAQKELEEIKEKLENGKITIDENGVARNKIGRILMEDMLEKVAMVTDKVNVEATNKARDEDTSAFIKEYRENYKGPSEEELFEMRAEFGKGTTVVDIITGKKIRL